MAHKSVKIRLEGWEHRHRLGDALAAALGAYPVSALQEERDDIHYLSTRDHDGVMLKHRHNDDGHDLIFERADVDGRSRTSYIMVAHPRIEPRDASLSEIFGNADRRVVKHRQRYETERFPQLRLYHDVLPTLSAAPEFLELQYEVDADSMLETWLSALEMDHLPRVYAPYASMMERVAGPLYTARKPHVLFRRGDDAPVSFLILNGTAEIGGEDLALGADSMVGEFGILEGSRSRDVSVSADFRAVMLSPRKTLRLLRQPRHADKYLRWKYGQRQSLPV